MSTVSDQIQPIALHGPARVISRDALREGFFQLLRRSYARAAANGQAPAVYRSIANTVYRLCSEDWVQRTIFPGETALVRQFISKTGLGSATPEAVIQQSLMGNPWVATWAPVLHAMRREHFLSMCHVRGIEHLQAAQSSGRGVVVAHAHTLFAQLFWTWMKHAGITPGVTIWQWAWGRPLTEIRDPRIRAVETARELHSATQTLKSGGLCHVLADGDKGRRHVAMSFCGRQRLFQTTFAELALTTNAMIITVFVAFAADGSISIQIRPLAGESVARASHADLTGRLINTYANQLGARWREHPADIPWFQMKQHLNLPMLAGNSKL